MRATSLRSLDQDGPSRHLSRVVPRECEGEGTGWGTIEGVTLRVLVLASPDREAESILFVRAFGDRHEMTRVAGKAGLGASFVAARAAQETDPHLVHAIGLTGFAKAGPTVASGTKRPLIVTLAADDVEANPKRCVKLAQSADAVILDHTPTADAMRELGVKRDLYVIAPPREGGAHAYVLGAHEIVYGRVLGATDVELEIEADNGLVQIGALK